MHDIYTSFIRYNNIHDIKKRNSHHNYGSYENNIVAWLLCDVHTIYHSSTFFMAKIFSLLLDLTKINKTKQLDLRILMYTRM